MPHFVRSAAPQVKGGYRAFRPFVRADFVRQCAYCLMTETFAGGEENFELDHFRPKSRFPLLLNDFLNIYYACHPCNFTKLDHWPPRELEARGRGIVDLCSEEFETHFSVQATGEWVGKTDSGDYTIDLLRLNRQNLVYLRRWLAKVGFAPHETRVGEDELRILAERLR